MAQAKLTKTKVDSLQTANPRGERWHDTELRGFGLTVYPRGTRAFWIVYGPKERRTRLALGQYPALTVDQARRLAKKELLKVAQGLDPRTERETRRAMPTFNEWKREYMGGVKLWKKQPRHDEYYLSLAARQWGQRALDRITAQDVERGFQAMAEGGHKTRANRWLASVRACLQAAWRQDKIPNNPAMKVKAYTEPAPRTRVLTDKELSRLLEAIAELGNPFERAAFSLLIETGARRSEVLRAKWEDLDLNAAVWRIPTTKSGKPQTMPLPPGIVTMLKSLPRISSLVVPSTLDPEKPRFDLRDVWDELRRKAKIGDVTIHDLRRTFGLHVAKAAGLHIASKLLRHTDIRVTERHYAPLGLADLRAALEQREAKILPMRRAVTKGREE